MPFFLQSYEKAKDDPTNQLHQTALDVVKAPGANLIAFFPE